MALHTLRRVATRAVQGARKVAGVASTAVDVARPLYERSVRPALLGDRHTQHIAHTIDAGLRAHDGLRAAHGVYKGVRALAG